MINTLLHWWAGSKIADFYMAAPMNPLKKWFFHPVKRRIAKYYLVLLRRIFGLKVVGITGSVGKTTTKEMIASVLAQKYRVVSSRDNIDPVFNIPTTILKCNPRTQMLVLEMGIEYPGDMDFYFWLATPDVSVLTSIYYTHTLFLGSIDGVVKEKGKIVMGLSKNAWAVLNADDVRVANFKKETAVKIVLYGIKSKAQISAQKVKVTEEFKTQFTLMSGKKSENVTLLLVGEHWVYAALAAAACGEIFSVPTNEIKVGLEAVGPQTDRMIPLITKSGATIINDTYNSNPLGAMAALSVLSKVGKGKKTVAVLGDMLELGDYEKEGHEEVGTWAAKNGVDLLFCIGNMAEFLREGAIKGGMKNDKIFVYKRGKDAIPDIVKLLDKNVVVLFKASRRLKFDELVDQFKKF